MKKLLLRFTLITIISLVSFNVKSHAVQVGYCLDGCNGNLRVWIEHWHGPNSGLVGSLTIIITINGVPTTISGSPTMTATTISANLPGCLTPLVSFASCPSQANTYNEWVGYDFPSIPAGVPITITVSSNAATDILTSDCGGMYPAVSDTFTIQSTTINATETICQGDSTMLGGMFQTTSGVYYDSLTTNLGCDSIIETTLTVSVCTGIDKNNTNNLIQVYPNPTANELNVLLSNFNTSTIVTLIDNLGRIVYQTTPISNKIAVNLSNYSKGIYTLLVNSNGSTVAKKIVKE
ncbi:MAG: hypothetical protein COA97_06170 [Flavobacteriales bacterium]|nr:MAG: hypothetical protein COA97_06170 [Flavobacteriales bacterium]